MLVSLWHREMQDGTDIMKTFYIMNSAILPTGYNHMFMAQKIGRGFSYNGFKMHEARRIEDIKDEGFVLLSDHPSYFSFGARDNPSGDFRRAIPGAIQKTKIADLVSKIFQRRAYKRLAKQIKNKNITLLIWNLHHEKEFIDSIGAKVIYTGEYFQSKPKLEYAKAWYNMYKNPKNKNCVPLRFAADIEPEKVGENCSNDKYFVSYVGDKSYKPELYNIFINDLNCKINPTPPYISENKKETIFRKSMMCLGLTGWRNIANNMVAERVYESLAFGAICLTNNPVAPKATNGCAIFMDNKATLKDKVSKLVSDVEMRNRIRQNGFEFTKKYGTWANRAQEFIKAAEKLYM